MVYMVGDGRCFMRKCAYEDFKKPKFLIEPYVATIISYVPRVITIIIGALYILHAYIIHVYGAYMCVYVCVSIMISSTLSFSNASSVASEVLALEVAVLILFSVRLSIHSAGYCA